MTRSEHPAAGGWRWLWLSAAVLVADQVTKALVKAWLTPQETRPFGSFFAFILTFNDGAAFSMAAGAGGWQRWFFMVIAVVAAVLIGWLLRRGGAAIYCAGLALILGGAIGNLCDRVVLGRVVDFLLFHYGRWTFPAFNVADSAITIGAGLVILDSFRQRRADVPPGVPAKEP
jgi:signal peptidase II